MVRPGINLYGGCQHFNKKIKNVVSVRCPIIAINQLYKGETCGYNRTFRAKKICIQQLFQWVMQMDLD